MKFVIEISASFSNGMVDLSKYLTTFVVSSDYNNNIMPMWAFSFLMPYSIKKKLQEGDFTVPFRVYSIKTSNSDGDDPYDSNENIIYEDLIYEDEIIEYDKTYSNIKQITDDSTQDTNSISTIPFAISGLSKGIIEANSSILNGNYRNSNSLNALKASIQDLDKKINIITNDENLMTIHKQIIIPPMNLIPSIKHLITYYPIYNTRTGIFFSDKNNLHIFTDTASSLRTRIDVEIVDNSQEIQYNPSDYVLTEKSPRYYTYKTLNTPIFETVKKVNDNLFGIDKVIYSYDDIFNLNTREIYDTGNIYDKKRIYWDNLGDEATPNIIEDAYSRNVMSSLSFVNADPRIFDQYTYINLDGGESVDYLRGKYIVKNKSEVYTSSKSNFTIFTNEITVIIEKAPDDQLNN